MGEISKLTGDSARAASYSVRVAIPVRRGCVDAWADGDAVEPCEGLRDALARARDVA